MQFSRMKSKVIKVFGQIWFQEVSEQEMYEKIDSLLITKTGVHNEQ